MSITGWIVERLLTQNANKFLERYGWDKIILRCLPGLKPKLQPITMRIHTYGFLENRKENDQEFSVLGMQVEADDTISVRRVTVLYNRPGNNDSYELAAYAQPRQMHKGERFCLSVLHWRNGVGTFWGDITHITKEVYLDRLSEGEREDRLRRVLISTGSYRCEIVALHDKGETRVHFTVQAPSRRCKPGIVCPSDHIDYDANRKIPAHGTFLGS